LLFSGLFVVGAATVAALHFSLMTEHSERRFEGTFFLGTRDLTRRRKAADAGLRVDEKVFGKTGSVCVRPQYPLVAKWTPVPP
jgi:hypothetical protein